MATPFDKLIKLLEDRIGRQEAALAESRAQLDAAVKSREDFQKSVPRK